MDEFSRGVYLDVLQDSDSADKQLTPQESEFLAQELGRKTEAPVEPMDRIVNRELSTPTDVSPRIESVDIPEQTPVAENLKESEVANPAKGRAHGADSPKNTHLHHDEINELIERLKVGLWVDLFEANGQKVRAKIMAIVPSVGKYIFGDRSGKKLADFNRESLYTGLKEGRLRMSDADTAYDKTLESVISNLRVMKKAEDD